MSKPLCRRPDSSNYLRLLEEPLHDLYGLSREQSCADVDPMVQSRGAQDVDDRSGASALRIGGAVDDPGHTGQHEGAGAHGAGFDRDVHGGAKQPPAAKQRRGVANDQELGVGGRILPTLAFVASRGQNLAS